MSREKLNVSVGKADLLHMPYQPVAHLYPVFFFISLSYMAGFSGEKTLQFYCPLETFKDLILSIIDGFYTVSWLEFQDILIENDLSAR